MIIMGHLMGISPRDSHPWLWMVEGRAVSKKFDTTMWHSEWIPRLEKFSKKSWWAFQSWSWTRVGVRLEEDVPEQRRFRKGVDLRLVAMHSLFVRERERERERERGRETENTITTEYQKKKRESTYAWKMHEHVMC